MERKSAAWYNFAELPGEILFIFLFFEKKGDKEIKTKCDSHDVLKFNLNVFKK